MQGGRVIHFGERQAGAPPPAYPWFQPGWAETHARHVAHWGGRRVWPSCRAESKLRALRLVEQQLRELTGLGHAVPGQGPPGSRVLLLLKHPNAREVTHPGLILTSSTYQDIATELRGATLFVAHIFPFHRGKLWTDADIPTSAAEAFGLYLRAVVRILAPKVVLCPGRYVAQYARAACRAKNIPDVPDTPLNEFIRVTINRTPTHLFRIVHPFQASPRCEGSSREQRQEYGKLLREGLAMVSQFVTVSRKPLDATALLMRGEKVPLGAQGSAAQALLPGIDEPGNFAWVRKRRLATMDRPATKRQITVLAQRRQIRLVVNLTPKPHPRSWFRGIPCREVHCPVPDDGGVPSAADARRARDEVRGALAAGQAVAVHRTYGPGAPGFFVRHILGERGSAPELTPVQREFLRSFNDGEDPEAAPGTGSADPIEEAPRSPPRKRQRLATPHSVWLITGRGEHRCLERTFASLAHAQAFVRRGNRALERSAPARTRLRETSGLLRPPLRRKPTLYCLRSNDVDVYELQDPDTGKVLKRSYGKPRDDPSGGVVVVRPRCEREAGRVDPELWSRYSRGLVASV